MVSARAQPQKTKFSRCHHGPDPQQQMVSLQFSSSLRTRDAGKEFATQGIWVAEDGPIHFTRMQDVSADMSIALCKVKRP